MVDEGVENVFGRHHAIAEHTRNGAEKLGLDILTRTEGSHLIR